MKIELTIKVDYLPNWGLFEGIREILQNAKDAETEFHALMKVYMRGKTLIIENEGCTLPYEALLLGHSTKIDRSDLIGKFGEGFKLGILALIRNGYNVKIRNGSEVWEPEIINSNKFNTKVLAFDIQKNRKFENRILIEISDIEPSYYLTKIKPCFLWLYQTNINKVKTDYGSILLSPYHKGKIFVKGIWVETNPDLFVGYDLNEVNVDRDRKMVESFDLSWKTQAIWRLALAGRPDLFKTYLDIIESEGIEAKNIDSYCAKIMPDEFIDYVIENFENIHGNKAIPVSNIGECVNLEHFERNGIVVNSAIRNLIECKKGTLESIQESLKNEVIKNYSWHELTEIQKNNIIKSVKLIENTGVSIELKNINITNFRSENLQGTYINGIINISINYTNTLREFLLVLIHEVAHKCGMDGEKSHIEMIEFIWSKIVEQLYNNQS